MGEINNVVPTSVDNQQDSVPKPFYPIQNLPKKRGGARLGAGARTKKEIALIKKAQRTVERIIASSSENLANTYVALAAGTVLKTPEGELKLSVDPPTTRHAIDKLWPTEKADPSLIVAIQFNTNVGDREKPG